ncbi:chemotaxis protein CheW [Desulfovibrio ferrophilus]|uniref:CheW protein n=1 Tax=Desulfovibrio ferrophilus TaxID=241368 RepID=A0A2Z6AVK6_9BACT|nr:chemotaxis protein CheW [Desulfovibrio ferrophilus]BBD07215.1 CheW protein [Desulfovibrio ferrophilus]
MKTPEEYFLEKDFLPTGTEGDSLSVAEKAFLQKYMGYGDAGTPSGEGVSLPRPARVEAAPGFAATEQTASSAPEAVGETLAEALDEPDILSQLKSEDDIQLVGFTVGDQEFTVPINVVQEVIRYVAPTQLPAAPFFMAGIVNLRGRVTPLVKLNSLIGATGASETPGFIVVCRRKGLQLGLMIDKVKTMYRVPQTELDWGVEQHLGSGVEFVAGLMKAEGGSLIGIISIDRIVEKVLKG